MPQRQRISLHVKNNAIAEWLPQETIVFDGAQARLDAEFHLQGSGKLIAWDIVRLGRAASGEQFKTGSCRQKLSLFIDGRLHYHELNPMYASSKKMQARWGLQAKNTLATMIATVKLSRDQQDELVELLKKYSHESCLWGLTQKDDLLIVRYLGNNILNCRNGLECLWAKLRPLMVDKCAVTPRIWNT